MYSQPQTARRAGAHADVRLVCTSISCTCSSLLMYICCSESSSSLLRSSRVFPSSAAKCRSGTKKGYNIRESAAKQILVTIATHSFLWGNYAPQFLPYFVCETPHAFLSFFSLNCAVFLHLVFMNFHNITRPLITLLLK